MKYKSIGMIAGIGVVTVITGVWVFSGDEIDGNVEESDSAGLPATQGQQITDITEIQASPDTPGAVRQGSESLIAEQAPVQLPDGISLNQLSLGAEELIDDPLFELEPIDPVWAPAMEANLASAIHATTMFPQEIKEIHCRTTVCRVVILHDPSIEQLSSSAKKDYVTEQGLRMLEAIRSVVRSSSRVNSFKAAHKSPSRDPDEDDPDKKRRRSLVYIADRTIDLSGN